MDPCEAKDGNGWGKEEQNRDTHGQESYVCGEVKKLIGCSANCRKMSV